MYRVRWRTAAGLSVFLAGAVRLAAQSVVVSEIHYHPLAGTNGVSAEEYEFFELRNPGASSLALAGASFSDGITYTFAQATTLAPGAYLVLAKNRAAFAERYPAVTNLAPGQYTGSLANQGERLRLKSAAGTTLCSVTYENAAPWPAWADGEGSSLTLYNPAGNPDDPASWRASDELHGSPGRAGTAAVNEIAINEVLPHCDPPLEDAIELLNRSGAPVNVGGWYLSDDPVLRKKYRIPANTTLPAGGYTVFYACQFAVPAAGNVPFALSSAYGDRVYLTAADGAGNLTRVVDLVSFDASANGVSFGRYPNGTGPLVTQARLTLGTAVSATNPPSDLALFRTGTGAANGEPRVGPVVLSEIMYHPLDNAAGSEYVELLNASAQSVPLFDPGNPANTWKLTSGADFVFPQGVTLPAGQRLLVIGTNDIAGFRAAHGVPPAVPVLGPWSGQLDNAGERLRLLRPDPPQTNGFVPYIEIERVEYSDAAPWPAAADGAGPSLERLSASGYGNAATNWYAGPTGGSPGLAPPVGLHSPLVLPAQPAPGTTLTATVGATAQTPPTQVVFRTVVNGVETRTVMRDDGAGGDARAGDNLYTAAVTGPAQGAWVYYAFEASSPGFTFRLPDSADLSRSAGWLWVAVGTPPPDPVINEIMYHPADTNDTAHEYVELYNPGSSPVNLAGWELNGAGLVISNAVSLAAGGYRVLCASTNAIKTRYGITAVTGNWLGELKNSGEELRLINPYGRAVDAAEYSDREPWPAAADGYGPSLERVLWSAPGSNSANWSISAPATNWQQAVYTAQVAQAGAPLRLFLDFDGRCWVDDVSVKRAGNPTELVANGGFESGAAGWTVSGNHARSRIETGAGRGGGSALALAGTRTKLVNFSKPGDVTILYGDSASNHVRTASLGTAAGQSYVVTYWYRRRTVGQHLLCALGAGTNRAALGTAGTPGAANAAAAAQLPPEIADVDHGLDICPAGQPNVIRAEVAPGAAASVVARYRIVASNRYEYTDAHYATAALNDAGAAPDTAAGDGVYAGYIPAVTTNGTLVRYHVEARGTNGLLQASPRFEDPSLDFGYWVQSSVRQTNLPNWQLFIDGDPVVYPISAHCCAVSPDGQVLTDILLQHRGNASDGYADATGVSLRCNRGQRLDAWFAKDVVGVNFRSRLNTHTYRYRRLVNEPLAYELQRALGLAAPRLRHVVLWINGAPSVTVELEEPEEPFMEANGMPEEDFLASTSWSGREYIGGDETLDNFNKVYDYVKSLGNRAALESAIKTNFCYESLQTCFALLGVTANADQNLYWNMFHHRQAGDRRWRQYPWDVDMSFATESSPSTTNLHPYYQTALHPNIWAAPGATNASPLGSLMFYPESGAGSEYTRPFRVRQQRTLWRYCHTLFTTNYFYPRLAQIEARLLPVYEQLTGSTWRLTRQTQIVRDFLDIRRRFLMQGSWSDKDPQLWAQAYNPSRITISEIMADPEGGGCDYLELYNAGTQAVDLGWWELRVGDESYRLPQGTMLAAGDYLAVAEAQPALTNAFSALAAPGALVRRYGQYPLWDRPLAWTSGVEYASRLVEVPKLTLPKEGAEIRLWDWCSNLVDRVAYSNAAPWAAGPGVSLELMAAAPDNGQPRAWALSPAGGSPAAANTADADGDAMPDAWEEQVVAGSGGAYSNIAQVLPGADPDEDGLSHLAEYQQGTDALDPDSDDDGAVDGIEVAVGSDPNDPDSYPFGELALDVAPNSGTWTLSAFPMSYAGPYAGTGDLAPQTVPVGSYSITFGWLAGYTTPANAACAVAANARTTVTGLYARLPRRAANDFDGDGKSDLAVYYPPGGNWYIMRSRDGFTVNTFGYSGTVPVSGYLDLDNRADYGVYYAPGGNWYFMRSRDGFTINSFGYSGTLPFTGDFDGDGRDDYGVYYPAGGNWYLMRSRLGFTVNTFGYSGTLPVVGDFDGDGRDDYGVYYAPGGNWYLMRSRDGFTVNTFGYSGTVPVVGDFDGDGKDDYGVYYAPGGNWYVMRSRDGFTTYTFGYAGTLPLGAPAVSP